MEYRAAVIKPGGNQVIYASSWTKSIKAAKMQCRDIALWLSRNPDIIGGRAVLQEKYEVIENMEGEYESQ